MKCKIMLNMLARSVAFLTVMFAFLSGCISIKDDRAVETIVTETAVVKPETMEVLVNRGITAKFTPDRGQMFMELYWWTKRKISKTVKVCKQDAVLKTTCIGFFPAAKANDSLIGWPIACLILNPFVAFIPTFSSMIYGPFMEPNESVMGELGLFGNYSYLDHKNPKVLKKYEEQKLEERIEETPIRLLDFEVEIDGRVFRGENGVAYVGAIIGDRTALNVKVLSFSPPAGFTNEGVSFACGSTFLAKVPTAAEIAIEAEQKRLQALAIAQQKQAEQAVAAAQDAAQRELAMAFANAAIQGINAGMATRNGGANVSVPSTASVSVSQGASTSIPKICPVCYGNGKCRPCNGTGDNIGKKYSSGRLYDSMVPAKCSPCSGTGNCLKCRGKGTL